MRVAGGKGGKGGAVESDARYLPRPRAFEGVPRDLIWAGGEGAHLKNTGIGFMEANARAWKALCALAMVFVVSECYARRLKAADHKVAPRGKKLLMWT